MSHNKITVCSKNLDASSELSLNINDLDDVNISRVSSNEYLTYNSTSSKFENNTASITYADRGAGGHGGGSIATSSPLAIPNPYHAGYTYFWEFAAERINHIPIFQDVSDSNSELSGPVYGGGKTQWLTHVNFLTAGTYFLYFLLHIGENSTANGYLACGLTDSSYNSIGPRVHVRRSDEKRVVIKAVYQASASDVVGLYMYSLSNATYTLQSYLNYLVSVERI